MGFVEFVTFSSHILITHITTLFSNSLAEWDDLATQILFFIVMIPILEVFFYFVVTIFVNFFRRFTTLTARGMNFSIHNRAARILQGFLYFVITVQLIMSVVLGFLAFFLLRSPEIKVILTITGMILAILSAMAPLLAFFRIMISGWSSLFGRGPFLFPRSQWVSPFDLAGLLTDEGLLHFLDSESSPLRIRSRLNEHWSGIYKMSIISVVGCFGLVIGYITLDIIRERGRQGMRDARADETLAIFHGNNELICGMRCQDACNNRTDLCPPYDNDSFCEENCSSATLEPHSINYELGIQAIVIRCCFLIVCLPLIVTFHPMTALFRISDLRERHLFGWVIAGLVFLVLGTVAVLTGIGVRGIISVPDPLNLTDWTNHTFIVTDAAPAIGCDFRVEGLDPVRLAMLGLGPESYRSAAALWGENDHQEERHSRTLLAQYVFSNSLANILTSATSNGSLRAMGIYLGWDYRLSILSFPSTATAGDLGFMLENAATTLWDRILQGVVPFYRIIFDVFLSSFQTLITQTIVRYLFGPRRLAETLWLDALSWTNAFSQVLTNPVSSFWANRSMYGSAPLKLVVGDGAYGLLAKAIAIEWNISGVAFHAPMFDSSPVSALTKWHDGTKKQTWEPEQSSRVFNIYAGNSLQFSAETEWVTRMNWQLPRFKMPWSNISAADTFCSMVAGCATDSYLDDVCHRIVGDRVFLDYFEDWGRSPRVPIVA
jgi:hypothetical protein